MRFWAKPWLNRTITGYPLVNAGLDSWITIFLQGNPEKPAVDKKFSGARLSYRRDPEGINRMIMDTDTDNPLDTGNLHSTNNAQLLLNQPLAQPSWEAPRSCRRRSHSWCRGSWHPGLLPSLAANKHIVEYGRNMSKLETDTAALQSDSLEHEYLDICLKTC